MPPTLKKLVKRKETLNLLGVDFFSSGDVKHNGKVYRQSDGFIASAAKNSRVTKVPFANLVTFLLSNGRILTLVYSPNQQAWCDRSKQFVTKKHKRVLQLIALPLCWFMKNLNRWNNYPLWIQQPQTYQFSKSLKFLSGGRIEFALSDGTACQKKISDLSPSPVEIALKGVTGRWQIRKFSANKFSIEQLGSKSRERFIWDELTDTFWRHALCSDYAHGEIDEYGVRYETEKLSFADSTISFSLPVDGKPWSFDLPGGTWLRHEHCNFILISDSSKIFHERYCSSNGVWSAITTRNYEISAPWVLNAETQLSVKVLDVLELFADGTICFLNQYQFGIGEAIDVSGPSGLRLERAAGIDQWLYVYEHGELIGGGYFEPAAFTDKDGNVFAGWGFGQECEPTGYDRRLEFLLPWGVILLVLVTLLVPVIAAYVLGVCFVSYCAWVIFSWTWEHFYDFFRPVFYSLHPPVMRLISNIRTLLP